MLTYRHILRLVILALSGMAACKDQHTHGPQGADSGIGIDSSMPASDASSMPAPDADGKMCMGNQDCVAPMSVCDVRDTNRCVQCTTEEPSACAGTTPLCVENQCQRCTTNEQCTPNICLPDGSCADPAQIAYVDPQASDNNDCSQMSPCRKVMTALAKKRPYVKLHGRFDEGVSIIDQNVTLFAPYTDTAPALTGCTSGVILTIGGSSHVTVYNLQIDGSGGGQCAGIKVDGGTLTLLNSNITNCAKNGIQVASGTLTVSGGNIFNSSNGNGIQVASGTLTVSQAAIYGNNNNGIQVASGTLTVSRSLFHDNRDGGIQVSAGDFVIVGNVFSRNGTTSSMTGGVNISTVEAATNRLEFNTFYQNMAKNTVGQAVQCAAGSFTAKNNIMFKNGTTDEVGATCAHVYSLVSPGMMISGQNNLAGDPLFENTTSQFDFHLRPGSPAIGAADPQSDLSGVAAFDWAGKPRTPPVNIGAYQ